MAQDETTAAAPRRPYHWFQGTSVRELYDRLTAAGPDTARLEVRTDAGNGMWMRVMHASEPGTSGTVAKTETGEDCPDIDESRICPPVCP